jgi:hypothetical protein
MMSIAQITPEVVDARFKITCNISKEDQSINCKGIKIDSKHLITLDEDGIFVTAYEDKGSFIETGEDYKLAAYAHLFLKRNPLEVFDLSELCNMSFLQFIQRLIEIGKEDFSEETEVIEVMSNAHTVNY